MEFRLLVPTSTPSPAPNPNPPLAPLPPSITLSSTTLTLSPPLPLSSPTRPPYTCISYVWGTTPSPSPHPFFPGVVPISARTLPVLRTAILAKNNSRSAAAFWLDTFCVPAGEPQRRATLESMGYIYSRADEVLIVLERAVGGVLKRVARGGGEGIGEEELRVLEGDGWVTRVWTYQELANGREFWFVAEGEAEGLVRGEDFFNIVGGAMHRVEKARSRGGHAGFNLDKEFPRLSELMDMLADCYVSPYSARSAFLVMTHMHKRGAAVTQDVNNFFYAMISAISTEASLGLWDASLDDPAETFMVLCERSNDFSFIYSSDGRDEAKGKGWRPKGGVLPPIFAWHTWGEAQRAHRAVGGIWLEEMLSLTPAPTMEHQGKKRLLTWLRRPELFEQDDSVSAEATIAWLAKEGFCQALPPYQSELDQMLNKDKQLFHLEKYLFLSDGLFVPQRPLEQARIRRILIATQIRWVFGAPGLVEVNASDRVRIVPGIFVGSVMTADAMSVLV